MGCLGCLGFRVSRVEGLGCLGFSVFRVGGLGCLGCRSLVLICTQFSCGMAPCTHKRIPMTHRSLLDTAPPLVYDLGVFGFKGLGLNPQPQTVLGGLRVEGLG